MTTFQIIGRCHAAPPPADWREQLAARLGGRPRRIGIWNELALYGALECMAAAGEAALPQDANLLVVTQRASRTATLAALEQGQDGLPMPLTFLQTQPSQMLAVLATHLGWRGNACCVSSRHARDVLRLAAAQSGAQGVLIGWVDETGDGRTSWLRLRPAEIPENPFHALNEEEIFSTRITYLHLLSDSMELLGQ